PPAAVERLGGLRAGAPWLALPLGALQSLSFAPFDLFPLGFLCLAALFWLWQDASPKRAAWTGFAFAFGLFLAGTYWLYISIHVFGRAPLPLALFLMLGMVAIMGSYAAAIGWALARFLPRGGLAGWLLALPAAWVLMEWFRGWFLSGFPWLAVGYGQLDTWLSGWAPVLGIYGLSFAAAVTAGAVLALAQGDVRQRVVAGLVLAALWLGGGALRTVEWTRPSGAPIPVALVQGSIPQDVKWDPQTRRKTLDLYRSLTDQSWGARIVVWPEATLPLLYHEAVDYLASIYREAQARGADLVFGLIRYDFETQQYRNGLAAFGAAGEHWYYKRRLVPFGEFFPVPGFIREWMRLRNLAYADFHPGPADQPPLPAAGELLGQTICYEDAYAAEQLAVLREATLLVNVSNDAWFGDSTAPHQHLQIARMRSLEAGRWMMRATNNGISAFIDPRGRVVARSTQFVPEVLRGEVVPHAGLTPYAVVRNWPVLGACVLGLGLAAWQRRSARRGAAERV
ncbi:MAG: apolipoprotein N-acyltransferase, partial [Steroidobacteraceae bacterium]|nr:apolipoprotein N-acyltransferase [Steroidobacteraceae bacterium]